MAMISRRGLVAGLASLIAAPAIVRAESLMPVKAILVPRQLGTVPVKAEGAVIERQLFWHIQGSMQGFHVGQYVPVGTRLEPLNRALLEYETVTSVTQRDHGTCAETENFLTEPMYPQKSWMRDYYDRKDQDDAQLPVERPSL